MEAMFQLEPLELMTNNLELQHVAYAAACASINTVYGSSLEERVGDG